eukprot:311633-Chlamydomonas_euryale.AAC.7
MAWCMVHGMWRMAGKTKSCPGVTWPCPCKHEYRAAGKPATKPVSEALSRASNPHMWLTTISVAPCRSGGESAVGKICIVRRTGERSR